MKKTITSLCLIDSLKASPSCVTWRPVRIPRTRLQLSNRAYCVACQVAWNSLPLDIHSALTLSTFNNMLKTHLFSRSYFTDQLFHRVRAAIIVRRPCSNCSHVTAPINCRFIIIIITTTTAAANSTTIIRSHLFTTKHRSSRSPRTSRFEVVFAQRHHRHRSSVAHGCRLSAT